MQVCRRQFGARGAVMRPDAGDGAALKRWAVARTQAHRETLALCALDEQGFTTFCPRTWKTIRRARKLIDRKVPLFPGYVFVALAPEPRRSRPVNSTRGVRHLIADEAGRPRWLPHGFVEQMSAFTDREGIFRFRPLLAPGQQVRVRSGAFADLIGRIEALDDRGRAQLLLDFMSREVRVSLPTDTLESAGDR